MVESGLAPRPSGSEVTDFAPLAAGQSKPLRDHPGAESTRLTRAAAQAQCQPLPRGLVAALLSLALYCILSYLNRKRQFRGRISLSPCSRLSIVQLSQPWFIPWVWQLLISMEVPYQSKIQGLFFSQYQINWNLFPLYGLISSHNQLAQKPAAQGSCLNSSP